MPTTLELVRAERAAQEAEEARPPFQTVEEIRSYIANRNPSRTENVSLAMCVLSCAEREKTWHIELADQQLEAGFKSFMDEVDGMDSSRRSKFVFQLSLWKNRDSHLNTLGYREGFSYRFNKVHSLELRYGSIPTGSVQIMAGMHTTPLTSGERDPEPVGNGRVPAEPDRLNGKRGLAASVQVTEDHDAAEPSLRVLPKRKSRQDDSDPLQSPTKRSRAP
ncbi:hypothetical protein V7S43_007229 [Phytophthora oleae]|uniref:Initiator Rep protein domain-containing protein n=1 Tax=Phytophthora oleae TaxID=2107226 RepID=A0ABD3FPP5_9STRA